MSWHIPDNERSYLRDLAKKQAGYAALPVMEERKKIWYDLNDGHPDYIPPVVVETWTFDRDFLPERVFRCKSETGRSIEYQLLRNIRNYELIEDDKVMPDFFEINWFLDIDEFGVKVDRETRKDADGFELGYRYLHPIKDLEADFQLLKRAVCKVDKEKTMSWKDFLETIFDDVFPVTIRTNNLECTSLTNRAIELMGMEAFYSAMLLNPGGVHRLMAYLRDNALSIMRWAEAEGLIIVNNGNQDSFGSSFNFTTRLPAPDNKGGPARLCDFWGNSNSEETVGISPEMYKEFCLPYYIDVCQPMGLLYYGCCEPLDKKMDIMRKIPNLRKISVSPWCDLGRTISEIGSDYVISRKPSPAILAETDWDPVKAREAIREVIEKAEGKCHIEFIMKDISTVRHDPQRLWEWSRIAMEEVENFD